MSWLINLYNTNTLFHGFVTGLEFAILTWFAQLSGGVPTTKSGWITLVVGLGGAVYGFLRNWITTYVASQQAALKK
jgi:cyanate permease